MCRYLKLTRLHCLILVLFSSSPHALAAYSRVPRRRAFHDAVGRNSEKAQLLKTRHRHLANLYGLDVCVYYNFT